MKRRRDEPSAVWVPMQPAVPATPEDAKLQADNEDIFVNDRYQANVIVFTHPELGEVAHLSIKRRDRLPVHDWRDLQRIKNDLCGEETEAIELYPAESRMIDGANQYHLWAFRTWVVPLGFTGRMVSETGYGKSRQRPWPKTQLPPAMLDAEACRVMNAAIDRVAALRGALAETLDALEAHLPGKGARLRERFKALLASA